MVQHLKKVSLLVVPIQLHFFGFRSNFLMMFGSNTFRTVSLQCPTWTDKITIQNFIFFKILRNHVRPTTIFSLFTHNHVSISLKLCQLFSNQGNYLSMNKLRIFFFLINTHIMTRIVNRIYIRLPLQESHGGRNCHRSDGKKSKAIYYNRITHMHS